MSSDGIYIDLERIQALNELKPPQIAKESNVSLVK
jgi:hypothetical protein